MRYQVGSLEFDALSGSLRVGGVERRLAPQPATALRLLLESHGEMVPRATLTSQIWPGEEFGVSERLTYCLHQLRKTLAELGMPAVIETVPRRGYRCRLEAMTTGSPAALDSGQPADITEDAIGGHRSPRRRALLAAGIAALILLAIGLRSDRSAQVDVQTITASNASGVTHAERHVVRHAAQHAVP